MQNIRNIAIIAHVDHGKTTLVDKMLQVGKLFKEHQEMGELVMDSGDLERERGITITAKNVSINYKGIKINILDTPGHADFGGEVERVLRMADGVLLLVDAFEGPMPQTRFVLQKALQLNLKIILVINKVDKPNCRPSEVQDQVIDLLFALDANEEQLDFVTVYGSGKQGWFSDSPNNKTDNIDFLLDSILTSFQPPAENPGPAQLQITALDYSNYVGRIAIGRVFRGKLETGQTVAVIKRDGSTSKQKIKELFVFEGFGKLTVPSVDNGEICGIVGLDSFEIGDTISDFETQEALPPIAIDEPTISMYFTINNSPFFGKEGKFVTSRHLRDRLIKETEKNLALKIIETDSPDSFLVYGRGVLHLSVLIETMRREGYELQVGQPRVILKEIDGVTCEPVEILVVDVPEEFAGKIIELAAIRKGELRVMEPKGDLQHLEFVIPSRGLIGLRTQMLTASQGEAVISHRFLEYQPLKGEITGRINGVLISMGTGPVVPYALFKLQDRGIFFVEPNVDVYGGQVIGESNKQGDLVVNVQKSKQLTNFRASGSDESIILTPAKKMSLEECLEYIEKDEYVEVTPQSIRIRKIYLDENERKRMASKMI